MVNCVGGLCDACEAANCVVRSDSGRGDCRGAAGDRRARNCACKTSACAARRRQDLADERIAACTVMSIPATCAAKPSGVAYALRGLAYLDRGDIPHAIADLDQAVALAPDFAPAYQNRGNAWYARGNYGQAIADYDETIKLDPNSASPYVNRATVRRDLGYIDGALEDYEKAMSLSSHRATPYSGRGQIYLRQKDYARAIADFDRAVKLAPNADNYMLRAQGARRSRRSRPRAASITSKPRGSIRKTSTPSPRKAASGARSTISTRRSPPMTTRCSPIRTSRATYSLRAEVYAAKGERKRAMSRHQPRAEIHLERRLPRNCAANCGSTTATSTACCTMPTPCSSSSPTMPTAMALRGAALCPQERLRRRARRFRQERSRPTPTMRLPMASAARFISRKNDVERALADFDRAIELGTISPAPYRARAMHLQGQRRRRQRAIADLEPGDPARSAAGRALFRARRLAQGQRRDRADAGRSQRGPRARARQYRRADDAGADQATIKAT